MKGTALQSSDTFAEFSIPDNDKLLHGAGSSAVARFVVYDNKARRMSGVTADTVLQAKARTAPFPMLLLLGGALALVIIALLLVVLLRSGGNRKRPASATVVAQPPAPRATAPSTPAAPTNPTRAVLQGRAGVFTVVAGVEMKAGRDPSCALLISEPQVSSFHATVKLEGGRLMVKDERSNNGTQVNGVRVAPGHWTEVPHGGSLKFGPEELTLRLE